MFPGSVQRAVFLKMIEPFPAEMSLIERMVIKEDLAESKEDVPEAAAESELLARARAGSADAFCRLLQPLEARLLRQAMVLSGDLSVAEDLVSDVRIRAWKNLARYNETCRLSTWL